MNKFSSELVKNLTPYVAGEQPRDKKYIKLNTNENPYAPAPAIGAALKGFDTDRLRKYSDPENATLKDAIAGSYGVDRSNIFVGNGSDEVLAMAFPAYCNESVAFADITYSFYPVYCDFYSLKANILPLKENFDIDIDAYKAAKGDMLIVCNPNAPTGIAVSREDIESIVVANQDKVVLIDEAYSAFMGWSAVGLTVKYDNLLVVKTFSKAYSLAGARCGYAIGNAKLISALNTIKNSFNSYTVNSMTEEVARLAIIDGDYTNAVVNAVVTTRDNGVRILESMGFSVLPSKSNFLFCTHERMDALDIYLKLKVKGILVRHFNKPRISNYLRITVGTDAEMTELYKELRLMLRV